MPSSLETKFVGKTIENPFILASAPPTRNYESIVKALEEGWAGAVTKSVALIPSKDVSPRICAYRDGAKNVNAYQNYEMGSDLPVEYWINTVEEIKNVHPEKLLLVSLFGSADVNEWAELAKSFRGSSIEGFELNFSCPHVDHQGKGYLIGQDESLCGEITAAVRENSEEGLIIMPKLSYLVYPNESLIARTCEDNGANAIAAINTIAGLSPLCAKTLKPKLNTSGKTAAGGFSYETIAPFALLLINSLYKNTNFQVSAGGGVVPSKDSLASFFGYGANHVQICSAVMHKGISVIHLLKDSLNEILEEHERSLDELRGCASERVVSWDKL